MAEKATKARTNKDTPPERKQLIINKRRIDKFNIVCTRIEFTPAVCEVCGFDVCSANDLGDYWEMSAETQSRVKKALEAHVKEAHGHATQNLIYEDELPEKWLGKSREEKARKRDEFLGE
jgi:hypothetical protein